MILSDLGEFQSVTLCSKNIRPGKCALLEVGKKFLAARRSISSCPALQMQMGSLLSILVTFQKVTGHISLSSLHLCP